MKILKFFHWVTRNGIASIYAKFLVQQARMNRKIVKMLILKVRILVYFGYDLFFLDEISIIVVH